MLPKAIESNYETINTVYIDGKALRHNLALFKKLKPNHSICPVLKSNAYGHDLVSTAKILEPEKPSYFIVDSLYEAYCLRMAKIKTPILIMGYTLPKNFRFKHKDFHFTVFDMEGARLLAKAGVPVHIKIETGLNRMGFTIEALKKHMKELQTLGLKLVGVFSHLGDADNPKSNTYSKTQLKRFETAISMIEKAGFKPKWIHIGASAGALKTKMKKDNLVRLGLALYGINPYQKSDPYYKKLSALKPALELHSTLTNIKQIEKGEHVGYSDGFLAKKKMRIGVVPTGYFEGIPRSLSNKGFVEIRGKFCRIIGRVCMNYIIVNLEGVRARKYDPVVIYSNKSSNKNSVEQVARITNTIPNEILVRICESLRREVI